MTTIDDECSRCRARDEESGDFIERFAFENERLEYYDAPLAGFVRCETCDARYRFECIVVVLHRLWHWTLVPADAGNDAAATPAWWWSVVEDRRDGGLRYRAVRMSASDVAPLGPPPAPTTRNRGRPET